MFIGRCGRLPNLTRIFTGKDGFLAQVGAFSHLARHTIFAGTILRLKTAPLRGGLSDLHPRLSPNFADAFLDTAPFGMPSKRNQFSDVGRRLFQQSSDADEREPVARGLAESGSIGLQRVARENVFRRRY